MSEKTPQSYNPQANADFEAFTTKRDKEKLISDIIGDSDVDSDRYNEGLAYYSHLEALANETDEQREARLYEESLYQVSDEKLASDWDEALQENTEHDAAVRNERIQSNKHLSIAERASIMAIAQHEKLAAAIKTGDQEEVERIEERIESTVELIESQQAKDQEDNGDINDDIFNSFVNTIRSETASFEVTPAAAPEEFVIPDDGGAKWQRLPNPEAIDADSEDFFALEPELPLEIVVDEDESNPETTALPEVEEAEVSEELDTEEKKSWFARARDHFHKKFGRNKNERDANKPEENRKAMTLGILGGVAVFATASALLIGYNNSDAKNKNNLPPEPETESSQPLNNGDSKGDHADKMSKESLQKEREALIEADAWNIEEGAGGERLMQALGLDTRDWYANNLDGKLIDKFPKEFYSHKGDIRIAHPGELSDEVKSFIIDQTDILHR